MNVEGFSGYRFEISEPDTPRLVGPNLAVVAMFGPGWKWEAVIGEAREHAERVDVLTGRLERLLEARRERAKA